MKKALIFAAVLGIFTGAGRLALADEGGKSAAELEKEKAKRDPYPNDLGPEKLDDAYVKTLSAANQEGYKLLLTKCSKCHSSARPLNSQFVEAPGKTSAEREANLGKWKAAHPEMFKEKEIYQPESDIWSRYVKRMMAKPGCDIAKEDGKKIWGFLAQDSVNRKTGDKAASWKEHRAKLIKEFKEKYPARYKEIFGGAESKG